MKVISFYCKYGRLGASSRLRTYQFLPFLNHECIIKVNALFADDYVAALYAKRTYNPIKIFLSCVRRLFAILLDCSDIIIIEKELFPFIPYFIERVLLHRKFYIIDIDDPIFHTYDLHKNYMIRVLCGKKISSLMQQAQYVFAGSPYLLEYAMRANSGSSGCIYMPTVIDLSKYTVGKTDYIMEDNTRIVIGWIGTNSTVLYLQVVRDALCNIASQNPSLNIVLRVIGATVAFDINGVTIEELQWSEDTEVDAIKSIDIGIMPLLHGAWELGKCGYKIIQYMACGKPVVASDVGANRLLLENGKNGFLCSTNDEWCIALQKLISDANLRAHLGANGRAKCVSKYTIDYNLAVMRSIYFAQ